MTGTKDNAYGLSYFPSLFDRAHFYLELGFADLVHLSERRYRCALQRFLKINNRKIENR